MIFALLSQAKKAEQKSPSLHEQTLNGNNNKGDTTTEDPRIQQHLTI